MSSFFLPTSGQVDALNVISEYLERGRHKVVLLEGPPGSGKTEVYLQAIGKAIDRGRKVLVLVPEIPLTPGWLERFRSRFGKEGVAILHSGLTSREYDLQWRRIKRGEADVVIGTRSAVFSPIERPGLIVVDGEEDPGFKEQKEPRYHARDVAIIRAKYNDALVILESNTPSVESYYNTGGGKYKLCRLSRVPGLDSPPEVEIVDVRRKEGNKKDSRGRSFSPVLLIAIEERLKRKEKVLLFLNRRGFARLLLCTECGRGIYCPNCEVPLSLHRPGFLLCHYCNYKVDVPDTCPNCRGANLRYFGRGTQQACEELKKLFPGAAVERYDTDALKERGSAGCILKEFRKGKIDILVGTRMVLRENLPRVTLVGIVLADTMLNIPDFRSAERTFQTLYGLMDVLSPGEGSQVIIQTYNPGHYVFRALKENDYSSLFQQELKLRRQLGYPPFTTLINVIISGKKQSKCLGIATDICEALRKETFPEGSGKMGKAEILGPAPAPHPMVRETYRYQIIIKGKGIGVKNALNILGRYRTKEKAQRITIDVDPQRMF